MNMIYYILIACMLMTMVVGFPPRSQPGFSYSNDEVILCGPDLSTIAENLCKGQYLDYYQNISHEDNLLLLLSVCCVGICTEHDILTKYCMATSNRILKAKIQITTPIPTNIEHTTKFRNIFEGAMGIKYF